MNTNEGDIRMKTNDTKQPLTTTEAKAGIAASEAKARAALERGDMDGWMTAQQERMYHAAAFNLASEREADDRARAAEVERAKLKRAAEAEVREHLATFDGPLAKVEAAVALLIEAARDGHEALGPFETRQRRVVQLCETAGVAFTPQTGDVFLLQLANKAIYTTMRDADIPREVAQLLPQVLLRSQSDLGVWNFNFMLPERA